MKTDNKTADSDIVKRPGKVQNRFLDSSILLRETGSSVMMRSIIILTGILVTGFIIWANFLTIDEMAIASGEIIHQGDAVKVQHLVGGRVTKVFVSNGSFVTSGQTLLRLDPVISQLELESIQGRRDLLRGSKLRLDALIAGKQPDFEQIDNRVIRKTQRQLYESIVKSISLEKKVLGSQLEQVAAEIKLLENSRGRLKKTLALVKEELDIRRRLRTKGLNTKVTILQLEKEYNDALHNYKQIPENLTKQSERRKELSSSLKNIDAKAMERFSRELSEVNSELVAIEKRISVYNSNIKALEIKAPVDGYVHDIRLQSPGEIAKPGDLVLLLIPTEKPLVAKVRISARDIGHIKKGQQATLRLTTYDSRRYGVLKGQIAELSPSVFIPQDSGEPYYEGIINLEKNYIGKHGSRLRLFSGMSLTADIKTGAKTLIEYLLKPIYVSTEASFHER